MKRKTVKRVKAKKTPAESREMYEVVHANLRKAEDAKLIQWLADKLQERPEFKGKRAPLIHHILQQAMEQDGRKS